MEKSPKENNMEYQQLGLSDINISAIIMGCWQLGKTGFRGRSQWLGIDDQESLKAVAQALDSGITTFDTAFIYGQGHSEKILGQALKGRRSEVVLASKTHPLQLSRDQIFNSCHLSLKNLGSDYLDLYQIHFPPGFLAAEKVSLEETMGALNELKDQGKIRAIGVSNFTVAELKKVMALGEIASLQPPFSLLWPHAEKELIPFCEENNISVLAYSPLAQGLLTGKFGPEHKLQEGDNRLRNKLFSEPYYPMVQKILGQLSPLAENRGLTLAQLALAWVISRSPCAAIAGVRSAEQVKANALAAKTALSKEEREHMRQLVKELHEAQDEDPMMWGAT
jgi:myo-inositol catabolism protein IolS